MKITGLVHKIGQTEEVGSNGFTKRQLVVETQEQYKQTIPIDFVKDKTSLLDGLVLGQSVEVSINLRGNEYNGRYYANLQGWKIEKEATHQEVPTQQEVHTAEVINEENEPPF